MGSGQLLCSHYHSLVYWLDPGHILTIRSLEQLLKAIFLNTFSARRLVISARSSAMCAGHSANPVLAGYAIFKLFFSLRCVFFSCALMGLMVHYGAHV